MARTRLLDRLCALHPDYEREELLALVLCGDVAVDGERVRDPRRTVGDDASLSLETSDATATRFVGRGGVKLEHAIRAWGLPVADRVFADAGASTGGFTDCLLQHGARLVHTIDVGYNQLDYRLRRDPRVVVHERTNIMHVHALDPAPHAAVADLSFRSIRGVAARLLDLTSERWAVVLVKPQFEWERPPLSFDGTVPEAELASILREVLEGLSAERAFPHAVAESPVRGRRGNREFLVLLRSDASAAPAASLVSGVTS